MNLLRLILFIPATLLCMIIYNLIIDLVFGLMLMWLNFIMPYEELSTFFPTLLRGYTHALATIATAIYIYPYKNKYPALSIITLIYTGLCAFLLIFLFGDIEFTNNIRYLVDNLPLQSKIDGFISLAGSIIAFVQVWRDNIRGTPWWE